MFDTERFIMEIEMRPCIWKSNDKAYNDKEAKMEAWDEVAVEMHSDWETYSLEDKTNIEKELQKKWRNIKDYYIKELKAQKKPKSGPGKRRKYIYFDMLGFLTPTAESIRAEANLEDVEDSMAAAESPENTPVEETAQTIEPYPKKTSRKETNPFEAKLLSLLADRQEKGKREEEADADKAFFMSLLPTVKQLNDQQKLDLRLEILNAIKGIQYPCATTSLTQYNLASNCRSPPSTSTFVPLISPHSVYSDSASNEASEILDSHEILPDSRITTCPPLDTKGKRKAVKREYL